ncbi:hypothetical protein HDV00_009430 [Rhizophlyctis rosea]|nr:hypothetical protein HDV00_009430 [Rhizophlyctis rosea]
MPTLPLPKPSTEPPRPQRRHYLEVGVSNDLSEEVPCISDETSKILMRDPHPMPQIGEISTAPPTRPPHPVGKTGRSTYQHDFKDGVDDPRIASGNGKVVRMVRPKVKGVPGLDFVSEEERKRLNYQRSLRDATYTRDAVPVPPRDQINNAGDKVPDAAEIEKWREDKQREMDRYLYMSQYQGAYDLEKNGILPHLRSRCQTPTHPNGNGTGHLVNPTGPHDTGLSLYQNSFLDPKAINGNLLDKGVSVYGKSKLLYVPKEPGTNVRDLLHIENHPKIYSRTSYRTDYMLCPPIESLIEQQSGPALPMTNAASLRTVVPKAFKYRRWGGWQGSEHPAP